MLNDRSVDVLRRGVFVWLLIMAAETVHGIGRRLLLDPLLGDHRAKQLSVVLGSLLIVAFTLIFVQWLKGSRAYQFVMVGAMWVVLTLGFEVLLGRIVMGVTWAQILSDYNIVAGGLMPVGLVIMLLAPLMSARFYDEI